MFVRRTFTAIILAACCLTTRAAQAQVPDLQYLHPAGGTSGRTFEVELVGTKLDDVVRLHFSHPKITAKPVAKRRVEVTIAADAQAGECDAWAISATGVSAPVRFVISALPVVAETEPNHQRSQAQEIDGPTIVYGRIEPGTDTDWYRVKIPKGATLGLTCRSVSIGGTVLPAISLFDSDDLEYAEITHDMMRRTEPNLHLPWDKEELCYVRVQDRSYRTTPVPIYELTLTTGPLLLGMYPPALAAGSSRKVELYGYNLPSEKIVRDVTVMGGMYPGVDIRRLGGEIDVAPRPSGDFVRPSSTVFSSFSVYRHPKFAGSAVYESLPGPVLDLAGPEPTYDESREPHGERRNKVVEPQRITPPVVVTHRFYHHVDTVHWYRFAAKKGQMFWLEAVSLQPGRPRDLELIVHDEEGTPLEAFNDVAFAKGAAPILPLESRDPSGLWKSPADGDYLLAVRDRFGFERHAFERSYRLSVGPRLEDVRVAAVMGEATAPRGWSVAAGGKLEVTLAALRRGGQEAAVEVSVADGSLPAGLKIAPATIAAGKPTGTLTIEATKDAAANVLPIRLVAKTVVGGKPATLPVETVVYVRGDISARLCAEPVIAIIAGAKK